MSDAYGGLLDLIYEAAISPERWTEVLVGVSEYVRAGPINLGAYDVRTGEGTVLAQRSDPSRVALYNDHYAKLNPLIIVDDVDEYRRSWTPDVLIDEQMADRETLERTEYFNDFLKPGAFSHIAGVRLVLSADRLAVITIGRGDRLGAFGRAEIEGLRRLQPHLIRAFRLSERLGGRAAAPDAVLSASALAKDALMLVDASGRIIFQNPTAERLLSEGGELRSVTGVLSAARPEDQARLQRLIALANAEESDIRTGGSMAVAATSGPRLSITVSPVRSSAPVFFRGPSAALVCIHAPATGSTPEKTLKRRFGLTEGESRVALALTDGLTVEQIAQRAQVSRNTVRAQLGSIFAKTSTHRQAELVLLLSSTLKEPPSSASHLGSPDDRR